MAETLLAICGLKAFYGDFQALFGVDLELGAGEVLALIGANGAGKSTLLKAITGLVPCSSDMVLLRGEPIGGERPDRIARRGIALVPEGRRLFRSLSVEENLVIGGERAKPGRWTLDAVYQLFPILGERRRRPGTALSGGQQQMVAIGRALMANPDIILFDEISLGLAPVVIKDIYAALRPIAATGVSIILVEQDVSRALGVAKTFVCLQEGKVSLAGRPAEHDRAAITAAYFGMHR
ncbi:ABC transporter ATP-binding protein [Mesorhizobium loti]|uniref:ABC transporter ATP-binding protein n=1 Tax=Mesorhizobium jarvisii TaxID=1777867 RepID=A0A6M7TEQ4_9HYPH|nr:MULTISPECIES: ABC transporter ATP-binding protein [Mesorhizobium]OBQ58109.1 ABC transporter ATP-binding protein [Mesorhizobium loti]QKC63219.1 ABC transporter ATP-binding protein [Mesorhizobium jarvisii]QKD09129.1 ABC transporter ATP-binding protein [Mesorhizobium loti]RJT30224.1 ABC transporter ATP-binding protein [Mesorhizobium jarvisii]BCH03992.1 ABC transporter ATP-binding protein [Mesorhizobium sp. 131-2-5]